MHDKVFISYAKEDFVFASNLYDFLEVNNFTPWLDKKAILPGQNWNFVIQKALREANFIILLLSSISVQKRGYIQREFKLALEYFEEKLDDDIYVIPLKIDDCTIPNSLSRFQWVEYNSGDCFDLVLQSLNLQRDKYLDFERRQIAAQESFSYKQFNDAFEYKNGIRLSIDSEYFQFDNVNNPSLKELNAIIYSANLRKIMGARSVFMNYYGYETDDSISKIDWSFSVSSTLNLISKSIVSINLTDYGYFGGAHGNGLIKGLNYFLDPLLEIKLPEIFDYEDHPAVLAFIADYCFQALRKIHNQHVELTEEELAAQTAENLFWENSLDHNWENFNAYLISKAGLEIIFNTYTVTGYAFGVHIILIPYEKLILQLSKPNKLQILIDIINRS